MQKLKFIRAILSFISIFFVVHFIKFNFIFGSHYAFFSGINCITPLAGCWHGNALGTLCLILSGLLFGGKGLSLFTLYHIPSLCASFYWTVSSKIIRILAPTLCIALFVAHPIGHAVWGYSLYWLIPIIIAVMPHRSIFFKALATTFMAHAVGSVLWLYTISMPKEQWLALIPIVLFERFLLAGGIVAAYKAYQYVPVFMKKLGKKVLQTWSNPKQTENFS